METIPQLPNGYHLCRCDQGGLVWRLGIMALRNSTARGLLVANTLRNDVTHFVFVYCWIKWSTHAKRRLFLKRFIYVKEQRHNRKLMQLCFDALKYYQRVQINFIFRPWYKGQLGTLISTRPTVEELIDSLAKIKSGELKPEETRVQQFLFGTIFVPISHLKDIEREKKQKLIQESKLKRMQSTVDLREKELKPRRSFQRCSVCNLSWIHSGVTVKLTFSAKRSTQNPSTVTGNTF